MQLFIALALSALFVGPLAAQAVHVVDESGAGDFTSLAVAATAAADGDILLVRSTAPGDVSITAKSLTLVGDGFTPSFDLPALTIRDLAAEQAVVVRGLQLQGELLFAGTAVTCEDSAGVIWFEDCVIEGGYSWVPLGTDLPPGGPGLSVVRCDAVTLVGCTIVGGDGSDQEPGVFGSHDESAGGAGLVVVDSSVSVSDCELTGGRGGSGDVDEGERGGHAAVATDASLVLSRSTLTGGPGGSTCTQPWPELCRGGSGLVLLGVSAVHHVDCAFVPGAAGGGAGQPGEELSAGADDTVVAWPGVGRALVVESPVVENTLATIRYEGVQGDTFGLFFGYAPGFLPLLGKQGVFALGTPFIGPTLVWTVSAPDGVFEVPFTAWDLAPFALQGVSVFGQCFTLPASGPTVLGAPTALTIVDDAL